MPQHGGGKQAHKHAQVYTHCMSVPGPAASQPHLDEKTHRGTLSQSPPFPPTRHSCLWLKWALLVWTDGQQLPTARNGTGGYDYKCFNQYWLQHMQLEHPHPHSPCISCSDRLLGVGGAAEGSSAMEITRKTCTLCHPEIGSQLTGGRETGRWRWAGFGRCHHTQVWVKRLFVSG